MNIPTKYSIGDSVWILEGLQAIKVRIAGVTAFVLGEAPKSVIYRFAVYAPRKEEEVFDSRENLIKAIK
jgi:hypothetical protein